MIKKEFKEILPGVVIRLLIGIVAIIVIMSIIYFTSQRSDGFNSYLIVPFLIQMSMVLIWIANSIGITAFSSEYKDNALEYLLSSPFSKFDLLINKLIPRIIVLLGLSIPYMIFNAIFLDADIYSYVSITEPFTFLFNIILIFLCSFFLSLFSWKNVRMAVWLIYIFPIVCMVGLLEYFNRVFNIFESKIQYRYLFSISLFFITIILGVAFYSVFKNFDVKSEIIHKKRFALYAGIPLMLIILTGLFFFTIDLS